MGCGGCVSAEEAAAQPIGVVVGGRWDATIYYCIIYTIAHYLPAAHFWLVGVLIIRVVAADRMRSASGVKLASLLAIPCVFRLTLSTCGTPRPCGT